MLIVDERALCGANIILQNQAFDTILGLQLQFEFTLKYLFILNKKQGKETKSKKLIPIIY